MIDNVQSDIESKKIANSPRKEEKPNRVHKPDKTTREHRKQLSEDHHPKSKSEKPVQPTESSSVLEQNLKNRFKFYKVDPETTKKFLHHIVPRGAEVLNTLVENLDLLKESLKFLNINAFDQASIITSLKSEYPFHSYSLFLHQIPRVDLSLGGYSFQICSAIDNSFKICISPSSINPPNGTELIWLQNPSPSDVCAWYFQIQSYMRFQSNTGKFVIPGLPGLVLNDATPVTGIQWVSNGCKGIVRYYLQDTSNLQYVQWKTTGSENPSPLDNSTLFLASSSGPNQDFAVTLKLTE